MAELKHRFYRDTQRQGIGETVNDAGYKIMQEIDLMGKHVMEIGPGSLPHIRYWKGQPQQYTLVDIQQNILDLAGSILKERSIQVNSHRVESPQLPIPSEQIDVLISFYSLEHLYPLDNYISELERVLKPGGVLIGAIPAEGGLAWGVGRFLTSRRYIKKNFQIDPDKIISWMHPNFANKIMTQLGNRFNVERWKFLAFSNSFYRYEFDN
ncbi:MAG: class I SAM-dependent methyltransferase [Anaerolineales bacterium]